MEMIRYEQLLVQAFESSADSCFGKYTPNLGITSSMTLKLSTTYMRYVSLLLRCTSS